MKSLLTLSGFILLLLVCEIEPKHEHVNGRIYFAKLKSVEVDYCVTTDMRLIEGEHRETKYYVRH